MHFNPEAHTPHAYVYAHTPHMRAHIHTVMRFNSGKATEVVAPECRTEAAQNFCKTKKIKSNER